MNMSQTETVDSASKTIEIPYNLLSNLGTLAAEDKAENVDEYILKVLHERVANVYNYRLLKEDLGLDDYEFTVLDVWYQTVKGRLFFEDFGEFLVESCRHYTRPYFDLVTEENKDRIKTCMQR